jgi:hypothetical protein
MHPPRCCCRPCCYSGSRLLRRRCCFHCCCGCCCCCCCCRCCCSYCLCYGPLCGCAARIDRAEQPQGVNGPCQHVAQPLQAGGTRTGPRGLQSSRVSCQTSKRVASRSQDPKSAVGCSGTAAPRSANAAQHRRAHAPPRPRSGTGKEPGPWPQPPGHLKRPGFRVGAGG